MVSDSMANRRAENAPIPGTPPPSPSLAGGVAHLRALKALADGTRLRLLRLLGNEELNVLELCTILDLPQPLVSRHLAVLRRAGLVQTRREGTRVYCTLADLIGDLQSFRLYVEELGHSRHADLERLEDIVRARANAVRTFADAKAEQWDEIRKALHSTPASLLALANMAPDGLELADLGTGTGLLLPFLAPMAARVHAVDQSVAMLARARARCQQNGVSNVLFHQCSVEGLPAGFPACDAMLLHFVLHQIARPQAALSHLADRLKPGGKLVIVDRLQHQDEEAKATFGSVWLGFSREQLEGWLAAAGLCLRSWHQLSGVSQNSDSPFPLFVAAGGRPA